MNLGDVVRNDVNLGKFLSGLKNLAAADFELHQKLAERDAVVNVSVLNEVRAGGVIELLSAADIAVAEMMQTDGNLDEPLIELPRGSAVLGPEILPNLVRLKKVTDVEVSDTLVKARIVGGLRFLFGVGGHGKCFHKRARGGLDVASRIIVRPRLCEATLARGVKLPISRAASFARFAA